MGGWMFAQAHTNFQFHTWDFNTLVSQLIAHRRENPRFKLPTDPAAVAAEVDLANATRMLTIRNAGSYIVQEGQTDAPPFPGPSHGLSGRLAEVAASVKRMAEGTGLLVDWLGSGGNAVAPDLASQRALVCCGCPLNSRAPLTDWFTVPASEGIRKELSRRSDLKLATAVDDQLGTCTACICPLKLKVHCPADYIQAHLKPAVKAQLDPRCWMLSELAACPTPNQT